MADDLGTWPPEQARVLLDALQQAGLSPKARRTREGISVTVEDDEADQAHRTLVANMDAIAQAARSKSKPQARQPKPRQGRQRQKSTPDRPGMSSRFGSMSKPLAILVVGIVLALLIRPLMIPIIVFTIAALVYVLGKQAQNDDGPGGQGFGGRGGL